MRDDMLHYRDCRRVGPCLSALVCRAWLAIGLLGFFVIGGAIAQAAESTPPPTVPFSPPVVRLNLSEAMALMKKQGIRHLPVTADATIIGVLSVSDLLRGFEDQRSV